MSDYPKYGPWHVLKITWSRVEPKYIFQIMSEDPLPAGLDEGDVEFHYELEHPESCGQSCFGCGVHPHCSIDYEIVQIGRDAYHRHNKPGTWRARWVFDVIRGFDYTEYDSWIEIDAPD